MAQTLDSSQKTATNRARLLRLLRRNKSAKSVAGTIKATTRDGAAPLSFTQESLWFQHQKESVGAAYHVPLVLLVRGPLHAMALHRAFLELLRRHEALRTRFAEPQGQVVQVIDPAESITISVTDLARLKGVVRESESQRSLAQELLRPFDLFVGPLIRLHLVRLGEGEHLLQITLHHIICDGWSVAILLRELVALYNASLQGTSCSLPPLPIQFADYCVWQRQRFEEGALRSQLNYWRTQLADVPLALNLHTDRPRPATQSFRGARLISLLPRQLSSELATLGAQEGVTPFMTLLTGLNVLLGRYSGQSNIVVGGTISNRTLTESRSLIGCLVNTLPFRTDLSGNPPVRELLARVREVALDAYRNQDVPFHMLVESLKASRDLSRTPLIQIVLNMLDFVPEQAGFDGLDSEQVFVDEPGSLFDLMLTVEQAEGRLRLTASYNLDIFKRATIERLLCHFEALLEGIVSDPDRRIGELTLLREAEHHQVLVEWNDTAADYPRDKCIHELFATQAARRPDGVALVYEDQRLSYGELDRRSNRLAHHLRGLGVGPEMVVGLCLERSPEMVLGLLGILKAGGAYLPLDPGYPPDRLSFMLADAKCPVLLTQAALVDTLPAPGTTLICLDSLSLPAVRCPETAPRVDVGSDNLAYVIYTSGSTGQPKGVMISHAGIRNRLLWMQETYNLGADDGVVQKTPFSFDVSVWEFFWPLITGARLEVAPPGSHRDPEEMVRMVERAGVTAMHYVPSMLQHFLNVEGLKRRTASLRWVFASGEALGGDLAWRFHERCGCELYNLYGPTEASVEVSSWRCEAVQGATVPIGRPVANTRLLILDRELEPVPAGISGELYLGGVQLARGYLGRPGLTGERFIPDAFAAELGGRLYRTGDLARWRSDGAVEYLGRVDHQVKVRGYRIELGEIEAILAGQEDICEAVVLAREDAPGDQRLVGYVSLRSDALEDASAQAGEGVREDRVAEWGEIWDSTYAEEQSGSGPDFTGWTSSYSGAPIAAGEMSEWLEHTVSRILSLQPKRVLEIGCGTGLPLMGVAPSCTRYWATDHSGVVLKALERHLSEDRSAYGHVRLLEQPASDFTEIEPGSFDLVVLNSVVQYFPDVDYLVSVLEQAVGAVGDGGAVFVGDVRHLGLLRAFHSDVALHWAAPSDAGSQVCQQAEQRMAQEKELLLDPAFFEALRHRIKGIGWVEIQLKGGHHHNELTRYRYDVVLHVGRRPAPAIEELALDWRQERPSLPQIRALAERDRPGVMRISGVVNARLSAALAQLRALDEGGEEITVGDIGSALPAPGGDGLDPADLWGLGEELGYAVKIGWSGAAALGCYDVVWLKGGSADTQVVRFGRDLTPSERLADLKTYANNPLARTAAAHFAARLRETLKQRLPEYMVPSTVMVLDRLPLTPNGKLDREALPAPDGRAELKHDYVAPRTPAEEVLASIWSEVLRLDRVGIHDNFFELGGHSLLATRVISRVRDALQLELPLRLLFEAPTITEVAEGVEALQRSGSEPLVPALRPQARDGAVALSFAQERLWFLDQLENLGAAYHVPFAVRLGGRLNVQALSAAFDEVVRRHEVLRTHFESVVGQPVQIVGETQRVFVRSVDLSDLTAGSLTSERCRLVAAEASQPFSLTRGPLVRMTLVRWAEREHILLGTLHHIVSDGWSMGVLVREVAALYDAYDNGAESPLPPLPVQYADYAIWQRAWFKDDVLARQLTYWRDRLSTAPRVLDLPTDRRRPEAISFQGAQRSFALSNILSDELAALSREKGVSLFMTLLAAFQVLLSRYSGQDDVVVGTPVANRAEKQTEALIGIFVNTLALRTDLSGNPSFVELLAQVRDVCLGAYTHQDLPFEKLVEDLQPVRDLGRHPIFQVFFVFQNQPMDEIKIGHLEIDLLDRQTSASKFDLTLELSESADGLRGQIDYATDLFDEATIDRLLGHFETLLTGIVADPGCPIMELPLLSPAEHDRQLVEWNDTAATYPRDRCLHELFAEQVAVTPDAVALVYEDQRLSYGELDRRSNQLAHHLQALGVEPEVVVGLCLERSLEMVVGLLGILKAGGAYLPLDPSNPRERLAFMVADAGALVALTQAAVSARLPEQGVAVVCLDSDWPGIAAQRETVPASGIGPENLAYVVFTSGSTGEPKGILTRHRGAVSYLAFNERAYGVSAGDVVLQVPTLTFDASVRDLVGPLLAGGRVVIVPTAEAGTPEALLRRMEKFGVTAVLSITPSFLGQLVAAGRDSGIAAVGLRAILASGEALYHHDCRAVWSLFGGQVLVVNQYGPTECTMTSGYFKVDPEGSVDGMVSLGRPIANMSFYVLDRRLSPVPVGVAGEMYIGGVGLARGYLGRSGLTAACFVPHPFGATPGERLYRTGDLVRWRADGTLEFLGRLDHQVKLRGIRVELGEIEAVLKSHPAVDEVAVVVREERPGDQRLVAYVVAGGPGAEIDGLRAHLRRQMPDYMVPSAIVILESLPLNRHGKVDRAALPAPEVRPAVSAFEAPQGPSEEILSGIWCDILALEQVGRHDDFFELGGHSLLATRVISRVRESFDADLPLRALFEAPTIAELADRVDAIQSCLSDPSLPALCRQPRDGALPLSHAQERLWFLDHLEGLGAAYNMPLAVRLGGELEVASLALAFREIVRRHEALRTRFEVLDGLPVQVIYESGQFFIEHVDLSELPARDRDREALRLRSAEAGRPFDLALGPLIRVTLVQLDSADHVLLGVMHHIASDNWSMGVMVRELTALYDAFVGGGPTPLPPLPIQYADYALWQRRSMQGEWLKQELKFWRTELSDAPAVLALPTDRPRPPVQSFVGTQLAWALPRKLSGALTALSRREGATLFMTLLTAFQVLLGRYSGQNDIVVGTSIANRTHIHTEGLIGFFLNSLALRTDFSDNPSFSELLGRVRERALEAYRHQEIPIEKLLEELQPVRDLSRSPLFQVMLIFQEDHLGPVELNHLTIRPRRVDNQTAKFDLTLYVNETPEGLAGSLEYSADLFDAATIERMSRHFEQLLAGIVDCPDGRILDFPLLTDEERERQVFEWNGTASAYPPDRCLHELLSEQAVGAPDAVALSCGGSFLSHGALEARSNQLAHHLRGLGVGPEVMVGLCVERSLEMVVGLLGILKAGGAFLPLDPSYPSARLRYLLSDADVRVLVTRSALLDGLPEFGARVVCLDRDWPAIGSGSVRAPSSGVVAENLAYMIYTSGSTGQPKGVMVGHRGLVNYVFWVIEAYDVAAGRGTLFHSSISFDIGFTNLFPALLVGGCVELVPDGPGIEGLVRALEEGSDYSLVSLTSSHLQLLNGQLDGERLSGTARVLILGGDALFGESLRFWREHAPETRLINEYGPTETVVGCTLYEVPGGAVPSGAVPIGRASANMGLYVLDACLEPVPVGVTGELYVGGDSVARGYRGRLGLTAERFIPDPFGAAPGGRLYRTGDLARWLVDGTVDFLGRADHQVKVRGYRIELGEVETALAAHGGVREAVVVAGAEDGDAPRLVAYVVPRGEELSTSELRAHLGDRLPAHMVPSAFVSLATLPLTAHGKVDRRALPAPEGRPELAQGYEAPRTATEELLAGIWAEVLRVDQVGVHDNFFELGGDSILSIQVIARANQADLHLTPRQIFESQTIASLAELAVAMPAVQAEQNLVSGSAPLTPVQSWFFDQRFAEPHHWNLSLYFEARQALDSEVLRAAVERIYAHHDALRLRFSRSSESWSQGIPDALEAPPVREVDLSAIPESRQGEAIEESARQLQAGLGLSTGPLLLLGYFKLGPGRAERLLIVVHHLVMDGISWRIFLEDLQNAYVKLSEEQEPVLPPKTTSFKQWSERLVQYARSDELGSQLDYWQDKPWDEVVSLPLDFPNGEGTQSSARAATVRLTREETQALLLEVPPTYSTGINDVLLTALVQAFGDFAGQRLVLFDLEGHGREDLFEDIDISRTIGWFTSICPMVLDLRDATEPGTALKSIKEQIRHVPDHGFGYGLLRYLSADPKIVASLENLPKPQISFNYLGQLDQSFDKASLLALAEQNRSSNRGDRSHLPYVLEILGSVVAGRFQLLWTYSQNQYRSATIEKLAEAFVEKLRALIEHCRSADKGYTPSDFPLVSWTQQDIDGLVAGAREAGTISDILPLSHVQKGMLFHSVLAPHSGVYVAESTALVRGTLSVEAFRRAWQMVMDRHATLRTAFVLEGRDEPSQIVLDGVEVPLEVHDWRDLSASGQERRFRELRDAQRQQGFDLTVAPLMSLMLIRLADDLYRFSWSIHHLIVDGWSGAIILKEVLDCYRALREGRQPDLGPAKPYRDYIVWLLRKDIGSAQSFWERYLQGFKSPTMLGPDLGPISLPAQEVVHAEARHVTSAEATAALQSFARQHRVPMNTLAQAAWALLLSRYSGSADVVFGNVLSGRPADLSGAESMVGLFINTLPMRVQIDPDSSVVAWLKHLHGLQTDILQNEFSPLVEVQGWSEVPRDLPLFETAIVFENYPREASSTLGQEAEILGLRSEERTNFALIITVTPGTELSLRITYDTRRFELSTIEGLLGHFENALQSIAANPDERVPSLSFLGDAERRRLLVEWNRTEADFPLDRCIHHLIASQAAQTPDAVAVVFDDERLTYAELDGRTNQLAHHLQSLGVGVETVVGHCVERSIDMLVGLLGILKAGGAYLPLDPLYPRERTAFMIADAGCSVLITRQTLLEILPSDGPRTVCLDTDWPAIASSPRHVPRMQAMYDNLAYVIYTSGSTGRPKGVAVEHRQLVNYVCAISAELSLSEPASFALVQSLAVDASATAIYPPLMLGGCVHVVSREMTLDGDALAQYSKDHRIDCLKLAPVHLLSLRENTEVLRGVLPEKTLVIGGEASRWEQLMPVKALAAGCAILNHYGPTEATVAALTYRVEAKPEDWTGTVPLGGPLPNVQVYVLDSSLQPVPIGCAGEIYLGGEGLARGYWNRPGLTAERFVPNPFSSEPGQRLYRTGDLGRWRAEGSMDFLGRADHQVKVRGYRVELGEIEAALLSHDEVSEAAATVQNTESGEGRVAAYIVPVTQMHTDVGDLYQHLSKWLPPFMVPSKVSIIEQMPRTASGKIDRGALAVTGGAEDVRPAYVAPRNAVEETIADIWADVLNLERVGAEENYFELGGHSLLAMQVVSRLQQVFDVQVPLPQFFDAPTVAELAEIVRQLEAAPGRVAAIARLRRKIEQMSSGEVRARLEKRGL